MISLPALTTVALLSTIAGRRGELCAVALTLAGLFACLLDYNLSLSKHNKINPVGTLHEIPWTGQGIPFRTTLLRGQPSPQRRYPPLIECGLAVLQ